MADNLHDVVKLLLARMDSHPEEFVENTGSGDIISDGKGDRWWRVLTYVEDYGTEEEQKAINAAMRKVKLDKAHDIMMDELLNGEDRRRRFQEEQEYERNLLNRSYNNNMGASLRSTLHPVVHQVDIEQRIEDAKNAYNVLKLTTTKEKTR